MKVQARMRASVAWLGVLLLVLGATACSKNKAKPLVPLALEAGVPPRAIALNEQGTQSYQGRAYEEAKKYFAQTVDAAPQSGPAHYNYALALNKLGETDAARKQFIEAANLAPGDKVIWNSPPLSPFGDPEVIEKKLPAPQNPNHRSMGGR